MHKDAFCGPLEKYNTGKVLNRWFGRPIIEPSNTRFKILLYIRFESLDFREQ